MQKKNGVKIMVVCAHGDVSRFCEEHEMQILETYTGDIREFLRSNCSVIVTDQEMTRQEYDTLKCTFFSRGIELVSTKWTDDEVILRLLHSQIDNRSKRGGRQMYGFRKERGEIIGIPEKLAVVRNILRMRDAGKTLREIQEVVGLSISTIQLIVKNRRFYEKC